MADQHATSTSWKTKPMPVARKQLLLDGVYSSDEFSQIRRGFVPRPGDKWFLYFDDDWLHFHRSATGTCVFQLNIVPDGDGYAAPKALVNRDGDQYRNTDDEYDVTLMSYLVEKLLLDRFVPFPIPENVAEENQIRYRNHVMGGSKADTGAIARDGRQHENGKTEGGDAA